MNTFFSQLKKETQNIRLSEAERETMRRGLESAFASRRPGKSPIQLTRSPLIFMVPRLVPYLAFVLILAVVGSGTAYAAESAVPGDLLYPVKTGVNEKVAAALAQSAEAKATWHATAAQRRMEEAEVLAARGTLTTEVKEELEANFNEHATKVEEIIVVVEEEDPVAAADISARFGSAVEAHSALLARLGGEGKDETSRRESQDFASALKEHGRKLARAERSVSIRAERSESGEIALSAFAKDATNTVSASIVIQLSDAGVLTRIEQTASTTLDEAEAQLDLLRGSIDAMTSARVEAQIAKVRALIERLHRERGNAPGGKERIEGALKDATTLKAFLEAQAKFRGHMLLPPPEVEENGSEGSSWDEDDSEEKRNEEGSDIIPVTGLPL